MFKKRLLSSVEIGKHGEMQGRVLLETSFVRKIQKVRTMVSENSQKLRTT